MGPNSFEKKSAKVLLQFQKKFQKFNFFRFKIPAIFQNIEKFTFHYIFKKQMFVGLLFYVANSRFCVIGTP